MAESEASLEPMEVIDPHFHFFDLRESSGSGHDPKVISIVEGKEVYEKACYEEQMGALPKQLRHQGGVFLEAVSVCHTELSGPGFSLHCLNEARFAAQQLAADSSRYAIVASCALEEPDALETLAKLSKEVPGIRGIRQIVNHEPSWPRNHRLGDLLQDPQWLQGFSALQANQLSFDLQLNPHQFQKAAELMAHHPETTVIIDHLGSPLMEDLQDRADQYWEGLAKLAALPRTFMKISMLSRLHPEWDKNPVAVSAVHRVVDLFGVQRCMFASNAPVDQHDGWPPSRVFEAFLQLSKAYSEEEARELFAGSARRAYRL